MSNMSHCRFTNTAADLRDCLKNIDEDLSEPEEKARVELVRLCHRILNNAPEEILEAAGLTGDNADRPASEWVPMFLAQIEMLDVYSDEMQLVDAAEAELAAPRSTDTVFGHYYATQSEDDRGDPAAPSEPSGEGCMYLPVAERYLKVPYHWG